jgi:YfiH family protein
MHLIPFSEVSAENGVTFLACPALSEIKNLRHCFSTRIGGVSKPPRDSLNLGHAEQDEAGNVAENYRRILKAAFSKDAPIAFTKQIHKDFVRLADTSDCLPVERAFTAQECDGLITDTKNIVLSGYFADCVPILLYDTAKHACGVVHAGWRGTAMAIAQKGVAAMQANFGTNLADIIAAIGPSIGPCCFLCHDDVTTAMEVFGPLVKPFIKKADDGRFSVDLKQINGALLANCGVSEIYVCESCTCCDKRRFFSHRRQGPSRGAMTAMIELL